MLRDLRLFLLENPPMWLNKNNSSERKGSQFQFLYRHVKDSLTVMANGTTIH